MAVDERWGASDNLVVGVLDVPFGWASGVIVGLDVTTVGWMHDRHFLTPGRPRPRLVGLVRRLLRSWDLTRMTTTATPAAVPQAWPRLHTASRSRRERTRNTLEASRRGKESLSGA
ncbi:hypothetical protein GCM10027456_68080 [Kineosporia babensis]